jgi:hypothetical protein
VRASQPGPRPALGLYDTPSPRPIAAQKAVVEVTVAGLVRLTVAADEHVATLHVRHEFAPDDPVVAAFRDYAYVSHAQTPQLSMPRRSSANASAWAAAVSPTLLA